jgi:hypothetical protein
MSFTNIAQQGIDLLRKNNQQHQMPISSLKYGHEFKIPNCVYGVEFSTDNKEQIKFIHRVSKHIDVNSIILVNSSDPFICSNLYQEFKNCPNVLVNSTMLYDIPVGNPEFYRRSDKTKNSRPGNSLVYDKHIMNAVEKKSGKQKENGPFVTDTSWFQGGQAQGVFRKWLLSEKFGLKHIIILDNKQFDVTDQKSLCMFYGEDGYNGDITVEDEITKTNFKMDFRSLGVIIQDKKLAKLLPTIKTNKNYEWKRTGNELKKIPSIKNGKVKVLGTMHLNKKETFYYTDKKYIKDWSDINEERVVTRYNPATSHNRFYEISVCAVVPPGIIIPGGMNFTYCVVQKGTGATHLKHLTSEETKKILKHTRTGISLHTPQTIWIPYATQFKGYSKNARKIIDRL